MTSGSRPVFILGVGAQKAGTTWLHAQLNRSEACNLGFMKEYHVWDAVFSAQGRRFRVPMVKGEAASAALRRMMQTVPGVYENYFLQLVSERVRFVGDITPNYACLDARAYDTIRQRLESAGFQVRVVFLMRDPVERNWSALRMQQRNLSQPPAAPGEAALLDGFRAFYEHERQVMRTDYPRTLTELRRSFDGDALHVGFYEDLFTPASIGRLSAFLGLDLSHADPAQHFNRSGGLALPAAARASCRAFHADVYAFCNEAFPVTRTLWGQDPA